jgi:transcriptional/translational regulatory protein YebC/TACO1
MLLNIATDNRNRTASEFRYIFSRGGGNLGESGCVAWMFNPKGVIMSPSRLGPAGRINPAGHRSRAEDVDDSDDEVLEIKTAPADLEQVQANLQAAGCCHQQVRI